jgi:hypothetical protein
VGGFTLIKIHMAMHASGVEGKENVEEENYI